jgi:hypothetical protein
MTLTDKQKKGLWIVAGALVLIHFFLPGIVNTVRLAFTHNAPAVLQKPSPAVLMPVSPPAPPPPPPEVVAATKYGGVWLGETITPDMNRCTLKLEIRLSDDMLKKLKGYVSKSCVPLQALEHRGPLTNGIVKNMLANAAPSTVIMTGTPEDTGIRFTTDQAIGTEMDGCSLSTLSITEFGQGQVAALWQETKPQGTCPAGKMMLKKGRG